MRFRELTFYCRKSIGWKLVIINCQQTFEWIRLKCNVHLIANDKLKRNKSKFV